MVMASKLINLTRRQSSGCKRAAVAGNINAQSNLGACYFNGHGATVDKRVGIKWFTRAAEAGEAKAQNALGYVFFNGDGVPFDKREAEKLYKRAKSNEK